MSDWAFGYKDERKRLVVLERLRGRWENEELSGKGIKNGERKIEYLCQVGCIGYTGWPSFKNLKPTSNNANIIDGIVFF